DSVTESITTLRPSGTTNSGGGGR
ncbi:uncharacterized protein METZ01_LOCUS12607, partial [marine metagenome]